MKSHSDETKQILEKLRNDKEYQKMLDDDSKLKHLSHIILMRRETSNTKKNDESRLEKLEVQEKELEEKMYTIIEKYKVEVEN